MLINLLLILSIILNIFCVYKILLIKQSGIKFSEKPITIKHNFINCCYKIHSDSKCIRCNLTVHEIWNDKEKNNFMWHSIFL